MQEHGSFDLKLVGQVLVIKPYDSWNLETALRFCDECKKLASQISNQPWAVLSDLSHWDLSTPDTWEPINELNTWANEHNCQYEVVITTSPIQTELLTKSHEVSTNAQTKFFQDINDGFNWLSSVGIKTNVVPLVNK